MKTINVESLAGRCAPSSDFVFTRWLAIPHYQGLRLLVTAVSKGY